MNNSSLVKAGIMTLLLVAASLASWEFYLRSTGLTIAYDDDEGLWADKRVVAPANSEPFKRH